MTSINAADEIAFLSQQLLDDSDDEDGLARYGMSPTRNKNSNHSNSNNNAAACGSAAGAAAAASLLLPHQHHQQVQMRPFPDVFAASADAESISPAPSSITSLSDEDRREEEAGGHASKEQLHQSVGGDFEDQCAQIDAQLRLKRMAIAALKERQSQPHSGHEQPNHWTAPQREEHEKENHRPKHSVQGSAAAAAILLGAGSGRVAAGTHDAAALPQPQWSMQTDRHVPSPLEGRPDSILNHHHHHHHHQQHLPAPSPHEPHGAHMNGADFGVSTLSAAAMEFAGDQHSMHEILERLQVENSILHARVERDSDRVVRLREVEADMERLEVTSHLLHDENCELRRMIGLMDQRAVAAAAAAAGAPIPEIDKRVEQAMSPAHIVNVVQYHHAPPDESAERDKKRDELNELARYLKKRGVGKSTSAASPKHLQPPPESPAISDISVSRPNSPKDISGDLEALNAALAAKERENAQLRIEMVQLQEEVDEFREHDVRSSEQKYQDRKARHTTKKSRDELERQVKALTQQANSQRVQQTIMSQIIARSVELRDQRQKVETLMGLKGVELDAALAQVLPPPPSAEQGALKSAAEEAVQARRELEAVLEASGGGGEDNHVSSKENTTRTKALQSLRKAATTRMKAFEALRLTLQAEVDAKTAQLRKVGKELLIAREEIRIGESLKRKNKDLESRLVESGLKTREQADEVFRLVNVEAILLKQIKERDEKYKNLKGKYMELSKFKWQVEKRDAKKAAKYRMKVEEDDIVESREPGSDVDVLGNSAAPPSIGFAPDRPVPKHLDNKAGAASPDGGFPFLTPIKAATDAVQSVSDALFGTQRVSSQRGKTLKGEDDHGSGGVHLVTHVSAAGGGEEAAPSQLPPKAEPDGDSARESSDEDGGRLDSSQIAANSPYWQGYLSKASAVSWGIIQWQKRYFVLKDDALQLIYFDHHGDCDLEKKDGLNIVDMKGIIGVKQSDSKRFDIIWSGDKRLKMKADDASEASEWVSRIGCCIQKSATAAGGGAVSPGTSPIGVAGRRSWKTTDNSSPPRAVGSDVVKAPARRPRNKSSRLRTSSGSSTELDTSIIMEGWLKKRSSRSVGGSGQQLWPWQMRYFVLQRVKFEVCLVYYKQKADYGRKKRRYGVIPLNRVLRCQLLDEGGRKRFDIFVDGSPVFELSADTHEDAQQWVQVLQETLKQVPARSVAAGDDLSGEGGALNVGVHLAVDGAFPSIAEEPESGRHSVERSVSFGPGAQSESPSRSAVSRSESTRVSRVHNRLRRKSVSATRAMLNVRAAQNSARDLRCNDGNAAAAFAAAALHGGSIAASPVSEPVMTLFPSSAKVGEAGDERNLDTLSPGLANLPSKVIVYLLTFCDVDTLQVAPTVCRHWRDSLPRKVMKLLMRIALESRGEWESQAHFHLGPRRPGLHSDSDDDDDDDDDTSDSEGDAIVVDGGHGRHVSRGSVVGSLAGDDIRRASDLSDTDEAEDEFLPVIIDNGAFSFKVGFAGGNLPSLVVPSILAFPNEEPASSARSLRRDTLESRMETEFYVGSEYQGRGLRACDLARVNYEVFSDTPSNWDDVSKMWGCLFDRLRADFTQHPVMLTVPVKAPHNLEERIEEIMFETFGVPACHVARAPVLTAYSYGVSTGLVVEVGESSAQVVPLVDGYIIESAVQRVKYLGARAQTDRLLESMRKISFDWDSLEWYGAHSLARDVKERLALVLPNRVKFEYGLKTPARSKAVTMPDFSKVNLHRELLECGETMFNPSEVLHDRTLEGIHEVCKKVLQDCGVDLHKKLLGNVLLGGGGTMLQGFSERLKTELCSLYPHTENVVRIRANHNRKYSAWSGGSILAGIERFGQKWTTRWEYNER